MAWGFISDVDFDSEVFRWMGKARFTVTAIEKLVSNDAYRARVSFILSDFIQEPCVQVHCPTCTSSYYARQVSDEIMSFACSTSDLSDQSEKLYQGEDDADEYDEIEDDDAKRTSSSSDGVQFNEEEGVGPQLFYIGQAAKTANWKVLEDTFSLFVASNVRAIATDTILTPYAHLSGIV